MSTDAMGDSRFSERGKSVAQQRAEDPGENAPPRALGQSRSDECDTATELFRVTALVEELQHSLQPGLLHRNDHPRPDGTFVTPPEERPHYSNCVPCRFWAILDPTRNRR